MKKVTSKELVPLKKGLMPIVSEANGMAIASKEDMKAATILLSRLNQYNDSVKEKKESLTKPINASLKAIRDMFKPVEQPCLDAIWMLRDKMTKYQTAEVARQREEEAAIASRVKPGTGNLSIETAVARMDEIEKAEKEVATDEGLVQFRETATLKIVMPSLIPREYMVPDEKKILADLKAGVLVPGCVVEMIQVPVNFR